MKRRISAWYFIQITLVAKGQLFYTLITFTYYTGTGRFRDKHVPQ
ncbi:MAG: hypothetical protein ACFFD4_04360 [Candidatus Odinarchaeota archaeon]